jgi:hypothetical protein
MPSVYVVVWCNSHAGGRYVLVATKRFTSTRWTARPIARARRTGRRGAGGSK